jgi:hypothetical protein
MAYHCNPAQTNAQKVGSGQGSAVNAAALSSVLSMAVSLPERPAIAAVLSDMANCYCLQATERRRAPSIRPPCRNC